MQQTQQLEKLVKVFGKGNLLEAIFIFLGGFQNMISHNNSNVEYIDHRNFFHLYEFINKTKTQPLDRYFKLKLSLQGLCLIYEKAYKILNHHNHLDAQEVMDQIYTLAIVDQELTKIARIIEEEKDASIRFLNMIINPKGEPPFNSIDDFEEKVLKDIRNLINEIEPVNYPNGITKYPKEEVVKQYYKTAIPLYEALIELYCQINNINIDKDIILALIIFVPEVAEYLPNNISNKFNFDLLNQTLNFSNFIQLIGIIGENYTFDNKEVDRKFISVKYLSIEYGLIQVGINKDILTYLINSDEEDIAEKFEDMILAYIQHESESINGEIFEDAPNARSETFKQKSYSLLSVEFDKRKIALYATGAAFTILLFSSILGKFLHDKYCIAALAILGAATLALSTFTFCYSKPQQQEPLSDLDQAKVNGNENKEVEYLSTN
ncbi:MAG: hypothetical protein sL5_00700 [Candidatus Mesenet longicola]|uniref:Uncharacterized protein n=1 Tax=Candidatus Mesenet longicola TaxID=1892558 RepID=A0A8J3HTR9_9RICK|nr:MAG: hypothetical protein sGL2_00260 [Candidatus Mesenet longicola]GHM59077.1 MAG: hypothetical protein sL5_00700 [Candidatus Mesenet longicola]